MFGWFRKKTELEKFCALLTIEKSASQLQENETEDGLRKALSVLLLYTAHHFWQSISESRELKRFAEKTNTNIVIFETLIYVWSYVQTDIDQFLEEFELEEDDPISKAVTDSLHISLSLLKKYWPEFDPEDVLKSRLYPQNQLKSMEKFASHLLSSYEIKFPALFGSGSRALNSDLTIQLHLMAHVGPFTKAFLPGIAETTRRMATHIAGCRE